MGLAVRKSIIDEYDEETRARIMDLAMTLGFIDQGLVRVIPGPFFSSDYDIPVKALKDLNSNYIFMMVILSNQARFGVKNGEGWHYERVGEFATTQNATRRAFHHLCARRRCRRC